MTKPNLSLFTAAVMMATGFLMLPGCEKTPAPAVEPEDNPAGNPGDKQEIVFTPQTYTFANAERPYRKAEIGLKEGVTPAVVLYLHGGSRKGTDNGKQLEEPAVDAIAQYLRDKGISASFIVPQCPSTDSQGKAMDWVKMAAALNYLITITRTDTRAPVYIFGGSMGGTGTWNMLSQYPDLFTAAMPCAGNPKGCDPAAVAKTPFYTVMGGEDKVMKPETVNLQAFLDQVTAAGGTWEFDTEPLWDHEKTCTESYTTARLDWVFGRMP